MEFGDYLKKVRIDKGLTMRELERITGISQAYISQMESKKRKPPKPDVLKKLANGLKSDYITMLFVAGYVDKNAMALHEAAKGLNEQFKRESNNNLRLLLLNDYDLHWDKHSFSEKDRQDILNYIQNNIIGKENGYYIFDFADKTDKGGDQNGGDV